MPPRGTVSAPVTRKALGRALRAARKRSGKTQAEVAQKVRISQNVISYYELGERDPTFATLVRLADAVGMDLAEAAGIVRGDG